MFEICITTLQQREGEKSLTKPVWACLDNADSDAYMGLGGKKN